MLIPPLPKPKESKRVRVQETRRSVVREEPRLWEQKVVVERGQRVRVAAHGSNSGGKSAGPISRLLITLGFMILASAFTMPWLQVATFLVQKITLADVYASLYSRPSPILVDLTSYPLSSTASTAAIILCEKRFTQLAF